MAVGRIEKRQWRWRQAELDTKQILRLAGKTEEKGSEDVGRQNCTI
jgi:hypothetical protein